MRERVATLLDRAPDPAVAREALLERAVRLLVADEVRILATLAHTPAVPLVHIESWTRTGIAGRPVLQNASSVGRAAGVALPAQTPHYVATLLFLGLVEVGPEDERLQDGYQALLAEPSVLSAMGRAGEDSLTPHVVRRTLRLSTLGRELWVNAFPPD